MPLPDPNAPNRPPTDTEDSGLSPVSSSPVSSGGEAALAELAESTLSLADIERYLAARDWQPRGRGQWLDLAGRIGHSVAARSVHWTYALELQFDWDQQLAAGRDPFGGTPDDPTPDELSASGAGGDR